MVRKTTLMRTIATLQKPDSGTINFNDIDVLESPKEFRSQIGYLPGIWCLSPNNS